MVRCRWLTDTVTSCVSRSRTSPSTHPVWFMHLNGPRPFRHTVHWSVIRLYDTVVISIVLSFWFQHDPVPSQAGQQWRYSWVMLSAVGSSGEGQLTAPDGYCSSDFSASAPCNHRIVLLLVNHSLLQVQPATSGNIVAKKQKNFHGPARLHHDEGSVREPPSD